MALSSQKVGVIGAGQMGNGIAHVCALAGFDVSLYDVRRTASRPALATINGNMARQVGKKIISEDDRKKALARIQPADSIDAFGRLRPRDRNGDRAGTRSSARFSPSSAPC